MTQTELNERGKMFVTWRGLLGLDDWQIDFCDGCSPEEMTLDNAAGECEYNVDYKAATIRILDDRYISDPRYQFKRTLIHELLHCKFAIISDTDNFLQNRIIHQLIGDLADTLYTVSD